METAMIDAAGKAVLATDGVMFGRQGSEKLGAGMVVAVRELLTISGALVEVPDPEQRVHLQFRRFAGCPVCNLHLRAMVQRQSEIAASGIREIVVFHSTVEEMRVHAADLPFAVVADPDKLLYREFGVESSPRALLDPRGWIPILRAIFDSLLTTIRARRPVPPAHPRGGRLGLPADFLIAPDGRMIACKYGSHLYDQWSVDELLRLAAQDGSDRGAASRFVPNWN
jgi:peroxiredoxin